jgi:hypothetical protein
MRMVYIATRSGYTEAQKADYIAELRGDKGTA